MILTQCAVCATELGLTLGKKCGRCSTRYCGAACQKQHWEEGGHDKLCKLIKKAGGAEQYNANQKYTVAVAVAAEACAEDTKGQTCYICMEAVHPRTGEGLVRGCACGDRPGVASGTAGIAHVSCLVEQARILVAEAEENNLGNKAWNERWKRWYKCSLCEQSYHSVVRCALGWGSWKTYLGRPEADEARCFAMSMLGNGLGMTQQHQDALSVQEAELSILRRLGLPLAYVIGVQGNLANTYLALGRTQDALRLRRDVYSGYLRALGEEKESTLSAAINLAMSLKDLSRFDEAKAFLRKVMPVARRKLGESDLMFSMRSTYAKSLYQDPAATLGDLSEAVKTIEEIEPTARRVLGGAHPITTGIEQNLQDARAALRAHQAPSPGGA